MSRLMSVGLATLTAFAVAAAPVAAVEPDARSHPGGRADLILVNGFVYTVDKADRVKRAVAIDNGRIVYVGSNAGARHLAGRDTEIVNLRGRMLMPGLHDAHMHPFSGGMNLVGCNLQFAALTVAEFQTRIQACLDETTDQEPDGWLTVEGWYVQAMVPAGTTVDKGDLDSLTTSRPILVGSTDGHTSVANSRALELAGITAATPDPPDGSIEHDPSGEPTGILQDGAQNLVRAVIPPPTTEQNMVAARASLAALRAEGVTTFIDILASQAAIESFAALEDTGELTARAHVASEVTVDAADDIPGTLARLDGLRQEFDSGPIGTEPGVTVRNAKLFLDGVLQAPAQTAALLRPYLVNQGTTEDPDWVPGDNRGELYFTPDKLNPLVTALARGGWDPHLHAIGDRAVRTALDAYEEVRESVPGREARLTIGHSELVHPADYERFRELDVTTAMGFQWAKPAPDSIEAVQDYLGPRRFARYEPEGDLYRAGARIALGSDWPVDPLDEWFALKVAITRTAAPDSPYAALGPMTPRQRLPRRAAIRGATMNAAYSLHQEKLTGSIEVGKLADLILLDRNLLRIPAEDIANTQVLATMVGGDVVYGDLDQP